MSALVAVTAVLFGHWQGSFLAGVFTMFFLASLVFIVRFAILTTRR